MGGHSSIKIAFHRVNLFMRDLPIICGCISCYYHVAVHPDTPLHLRAQTVHEALLKVINDFLPDVGAVLDSSP